MPNGTLSITNTELLNMLQKSHIDASQKKELEAVMPEMTDQERQELIALIDQSNADAAKAEQDYQEKVGQLNKEYDGKMKTLVKESTESAFKEYENVEKKEEAEILNAVDGEIVSIPVNATPVKTLNPTTATKKKHTLRNLFIIFLFLALLAGGALYGIQYLSNM